eukprot:TRINITY_DN23_c1_g1_i1.p1 TRINITY_DN23_c1_g1~~TRINITY_DN23_c1_g1_i1.p1  ORF type:complete len:149 (+),score=28.42 TRINITY_DN23_c1_g1_i1:123-569(+)
MVLKKRWLIYHKALLGQQQGMWDTFCTARPKRYWKAFGVACALAFFGLSDIILTRRNNFALAAQLRSEFPRPQYYGDEGLTTVGGFAAFKLNSLSDKNSEKTRLLLNKFDQMQRQQATIRAEEMRKEKASNLSEAEYMAAAEFRVKPQ